MPPWEISEVLLGLLVSDNVLGAEGEELEMAIFDISRAHSMAPMEREACIELPEEDKLQKMEMQWVCFRDQCTDFVQQVQTG